MRFSCEWRMEMKNRPLVAGDFMKLDGIQHNERCFEPELNSGLMNEGRMSEWYSDAMDKTMPIDNRRNTKKKRKHHTLLAWC